MTKPKLANNVYPIVQDVLIKTDASNVQMVLSWLNSMDNINALLNAQPDGSANKAVQDARSAHKIA